MHLFYFKTGAISLAIVLLYNYRERRTVRYATLPMVAIYTVIGMMHAITLGIV